MRVFELIGTVSEVANYDELAGESISAGTISGELTGDCLSDAVLETVVMPRDGTVQVADMELWIDGVFIQRRHLHAELSVERDYDNIVQGWNFGTVLETPDGVFGDPFVCIGPAIGLDTVAIYGIYDTPSGVIRIPLLVNGIVDNSHREAGENGVLETFSGVDGGGRFDGVKITKQFPPGHGLYRGGVGREIMRSVGDSQVSFENGNRMDKEIQLVDSEPFPTLAEIFEVENRKLLKDSDGFWINPRVGRVRSDETVAFSFEERDVLRVSTVSLDSMANVITLVIANGTQQKTQEGCGDVWSTRVDYEYRSDYTMLRSAYRQNADGSYTSLTPHDPSLTPTLVRKVETRSLHRCGTLVEEVVRTWELARTEVPRHEWNGQWDSLLCFTDDDTDNTGGAAVGAGPAYSDETEVFTLVSISHRFIKFIYQGYDGGYFSPASMVPQYITWNNVLLLPPMASVAAYGPETPEAEATPQYGQAQGTVTFFSRFGHISGAVKSRSTSTLPFDFWEETDPSTGQRLWGDGSGVNVINSEISIHESKFLRDPEVDDFPREYDTLLPWSISCTVFYGDESNFMDRESTYEYGWTSSKGSGFYYEEGVTRGEQSKSIRLLHTNVKDYIATPPTHTEVETISDLVFGTVVSFPRTGLPGDRPGIERLDIVQQNDEIYEGEESSDLGKQAKRTDTEQITVTVPFNFFLTCHVPKEVVVEFPWAENLDELRKMAEALAQESAAMPVFFTLPANFLIREAMPIHLLYRPLGIDHDIRVKAVRWKRSPEQPLITEVEARLYGW